MTPNSCSTACASKTASADPASSGTWTRKDGTVVYFKAGDFKLTPLESWKSRATPGNYPIRWRVEIPRLKLNLEISTPLKNQELALPTLAYWEGLIHATGSSAGAAVTGHGYLELTGYSAAAHRNGGIRKPPTTPQPIGGGGVRDSVLHCGRPENSAICP